MAGSDAGDVAPSGGPTRSVALLRGVNVGGRHRLPMVDLVAALEAAGCGDVTTYVQSGNAVFAPPASICPEGLAAHLRGVLKAKAGFEVPVVVRAGPALRAVVDAQPFAGGEPAQLHVCFLGSEPTAEALHSFARAAVGDEAIRLVGRDLYLYLPAGVGRSKLAQAIDRLGVVATARNWRTVTRLADLACP